MDLGISFRKYNYQIRGIAVLAVVLIHVLSASSNKFFPGKSMLIIYGIDSLLKFAVPLFVISTAYFLFYKSDSYKKGGQYKHLLKKVATYLIPIYIVSSVAYFYFFNFVSGVNKGVVDLIKSIILNQSSYHLWYIYLIISIYIFFPLIKKLIIAMGSFRLMLSYAFQLSIPALLSALLIVTSIKHYPDVIVTSSFVFFLFYIALGYHLFASKALIITKKNIIFQLIVLAIILIFQAFARRYYLASGVMFSISTLLNVFVSLICLVCVTYFVSKVPVASILDRFLIFCGRNSFVIYIIHVMFVEYTFYFLRMYSVPVTSFMFNIIVLSVSLSCSLAFTWLFTKLAFVKYISISGLKVMFTKVNFNAVRFSLLTPKLKDSQSE